MPDITTATIEADFDDFSGVFEDRTITVFGASTGLTLTAIPYTTAKDAALQLAGLVAPTDLRVMMKTSDVPETIINGVTEITMDALQYVIIGNDADPTRTLTILRLRELGAYP